MAQSRGRLELAMTLTWGELKPRTSSFTGSSLCVWYIGLTYIFKSPKPSEGPYIPVDTLRSWQLHRNLAQGLGHSCWAGRWSRPGGHRSSPYPEAPIPHQLDFWHPCWSLSITRNAKYELVSFPETIGPSETLLRNQLVTGLVGPWPRRGERRLRGGLSPSVGDVVKDLRPDPAPHRAFPSIFLADTGCGCLWVCLPLSGTGAFARPHGPSSHCGPHLLRVPTTEGPDRHFTFSMSEAPGVTVALISSAPLPGVTGSWGRTGATTSSSNQSASVSTCTRVCRLPQEMEKHVKCIRLKAVALKDRPPGGMSWGFDALGLHVSLGN